MLLPQITVDVFSTEQSWHPTWLWPWWALILVLLAAFVWIVWTYRACRENAALRGRQRVLWLVLATLRFTLFGLLIFFSMGWYPKTVEIDSPEVVLCFDLSESMNQRVRGNSSSDVPSTRLGRVKDALAKASLEGQGDWEFKWYGIGSKLELPFSEGAWTSLGGCRFRISTRRWPSRSVDSNGGSTCGRNRVGDGWDQCGGAEVVGCLSIGQPTQGSCVYGFLGRGRCDSGCWIDLVTAPTQALVGETVLMEVGVDAREIEGKTLKLQMRQGTDDQLLQEQTWVPKSKESGEEI